MSKVIDEAWKAAEVELEKYYAEFDLVDMSDFGIGLPTFVDKVFDILSKHGLLLGHREESKDKKLIDTEKV